jgi:hypothetical protein
LAVWCRAAAEPASPPLGEPNYWGLVERYVPIPLAGKRPDFADRIERGPLRRHCEEMAVLARLWQATGRGDYAEASRERLTALMDVWQIQRRSHQEGIRPWKRVCFFSLYPILDTYRVLAAGGQLEAESQRRFRLFAREACFPLEQGVFNQSLARAAGLALAAHLLAELPEAAAWRKAAEATWDEWLQLGDTTENAACYNGISLVFLFLLGDALDKAVPLDDAAVRRMFERLRDQASPLGVVPEYGDSGDADWGMFHCWGDWVAGFERAARVYRDPTYRWAAVRMYQAAAHHRPAPPEAAVDAMSTAYALCLAHQWRDARLVPRPCAASSAVTYRGEPGSRGVPDKLILAPSRQPGAPFVMAELFARSYHAHEEQLGAILYYEFEDVPLLHGLGYHNRAGAEANLLWMCPADEPFPHRPQAVVGGVWQEASLPLGRLPPVVSPRPLGEGQGVRAAPATVAPPTATPPRPHPNPLPEGEGTLRHFDKLTFRVAEEGPVDLYLANLRLSGPKGERLLDDFHQARTWRGGRQALVPGPAPAQQALRVSLPRGASFLWRAGFDTTFSLADYNRVRFSWMLEGVDEGWSNSLIFRVDASPTDFHVPLRPQPGRIVRSRAETRGGDQCGQFEAAAWFTDDSRLVRRMFLLGEGALVVDDELLPGPQADGWTAGPLWHLFGRPREAGTWFDAPGPRRLLVWFAEAPGRTVGVQTVRLWSGVEPSTVFARQRLKAGQLARFVTVLVPHRPEVDPAGLAAGVRMVQSDPGRLDLNLPLPGGVVDLQVNADGTWQARRPR